MVYAAGSEPSENLAIPGQITANLLHPAIYQSHLPDVSPVDVSDTVLRQTPDCVTMRGASARLVAAKRRALSPRLQSASESFALLDSRRVAGQPLVRRILHVPLGIFVQMALFAVDTAVISDQSFFG